MKSQKINREEIHTLQEIAAENDENASPNKRRRTSSAEEPFPIKPGEVEIVESD